MNINEVIASARKCFIDIEDTLLAKNKDYASRDDALANFDRVANICKELNVDVRSRDGVFIFFVVHKLCRAANLVSNQLDTPMNESLEDTLRDLITYTTIFRASKEGK